MDALQMPLFTTVTGRLDFYGWKPRGNESKHWLRVIWHKTTGVHSFDSSCNWRYSNMESIDRQQYTPSTLSIPPSTYLFNSFIHGRTWLDSYCYSSNPTVNLQLSHTWESMVRQLLYTPPIPSWTFTLPLARSPPPLLLSAVSMFYTSGSLSPPKNYTFTKSYYNTHTTKSL